MAYFDMSRGELEQYLPEVDEPDDFDEFWARTIAEARAAGAAFPGGGAPLLERLDIGLTQVTVDDVTFLGFGAHPVRAWLTRPAHAEGPLPAVVQYQGYGGGRGLPHEHLAYAAAGYAHLMMDTRGQGSTWGGGSTPDPVGAGPAVPGVMTRGIEDPHDHYYRRLFTDGVRAVDAVRSIDGIDPERVAVLGTSQGGGIAIAVAGLLDDLAAAVPDVPFLCHYRRAVEISDSMPYGEIRQYLHTHRGPEVEARTWRTFSYLDGISFARRANAPALFSTALMDDVCPPSTVYAARNNWGSAGSAAPGTPEIDVYPYNGHEGGEGHRFARHLEFLREHLK
ncbi:acetylxylan esterase [Myceligenerans indicum]|uniref:Acetylxylan esterase n=1 Tax=Myceligenerans indicum TaxID=2593663 RepID=A0ABS1LHC4_9MICO|nr:acetylxylan esterase [Myceligenerans indicum]MBL0885559.1 acetylxylan esterase [Myceligenerans indicum]